MIFKKIIAGACLAAVMTGQIAFAAESTDEFICSDWAKYEIGKAVEAGFVSDNITDYTQKITRRMFCNMIADMLIECGVDLAEAENKFSDLQETDLKIASLNAMGIAEGVTENEFAPDAFLTREQAATFIFRTYNYVRLNEYFGEGYDDLKYRFADDSEISEWARDGVYNMYKTGIIYGTDIGFEPKGDFTIEQSVALLLRLSDKINRRYHNAEEFSYSDMEKLQNRADNGEETWRLNPDEVASRFIENEKFGDGEMIVQDVVGYAVLYITTDEKMYSIALFQPMEQGDNGIYVVSGYYETTSKYAIKNITFYNSNNEAVKSGGFGYRLDKGGYAVVEFIGNTPQKVTVLYTDAGENPQVYNQEFAIYENPEKTIKIELPFESGDIIHLQLAVAYSDDVEKLSQHYQIEFTGE